ncbi:hypothetical protein HDV00_009014 [Rhizophlyctis rosea]|nr:hypothetical protein HDV00_009014 [Rhizophlyctis rosea]
MESEIRSLLGDILKYYEARQQKVVWIFDQYNALIRPNEDLSTTFPFSLPTYLATSLDQTVVLIASANNFLPFNKAQFRHVRLHVPFSIKETIAYCGKKLKRPLLPEEVQELAYWSGGFPLELREFCALEQYRREIKWTDEDNIREAVARMVLGVASIKKPLFVTDRRLMRIVGRYEYVAMTPVARSALRQAVQPFASDIDMVARLILSDPKYTNDTKGRIVERFVIESLCRSQQFDFTIRSAISVDHPFNLRGQIRGEIVEFYRMGIPSKLPVQTTSSSTSLP